MLRRTFGQFNSRILPRLLNTYIRPVIGYALPAWQPRAKKDVNLLDRIYHRATRLVPGFRYLQYEDRLLHLGLQSLRQRSMRQDLILLNKILNNDNHPLRHLFQMCPGRNTRKNDRAVVIPHSRRDCRWQFFSVRVCFSWNSLPTEVTASPTLQLFIFQLDAYISAH